MAKPIDLNYASEEEIASLPGVDPEVAKNLIENRPFLDWDEVADMPGITEATLESLRDAGVMLGPDADEEEDIEDLDIDSELEEENEAVGEDDIKENAA
jgi:hypothetical protein